MSGHTPWEPTEEALGAALTAIDHARLPWLARWALRDGGKARSTVARETARRVEGRVAARVREETTARINDSWATTLEEQAAADMPDPEPLPAFNSVGACPKCLRTPDPASRRAEWRGGDLGGLRTGLPEAMKRTCGRCGFWWLESPADAAEPSAVEGAGGEQPDAEAENRALHDALDYQASIVGRVEEVADWGVPVGPEVLRVALDPAQSLQGAEEAAHAAAQTEK